MKMKMKQKLWMTILMKNAQKGSCSRICTSKCKFAFPDTAFATPPDPYPRSGGTMNLFFSPFFIPMTPWSNPAGTYPTPTTNLIGLPASSVLSNFLALGLSSGQAFSHPVKLHVTLAHLAIASPVPSYLPCQSLHGVI